MRIEVPARITQQWLRARSTEELEGALLTVNEEPGAPSDRQARVEDEVLWRRSPLGKLYDATLKWQRRFEERARGAWEAPRDRALYDASKEAAAVFLESSVEILRLAGRAEGGPADG